MRIIIAGSRDLTRELHYYIVAKAFSDAIGEWAPREVVEVVTGGARGVDAHGKDLAKKLGIAHREFPADWNKHGKAAGPIRNAEMAAYADALVLVWDGSSRGSAHMMAIAMKQSLLIKEVVVLA